MPAEHGAWGILLVPYVCASALAGAANADAIPPLALLGVCILALFLLRGSLEEYKTWKALLSPAHLALAGTSVVTAALLVFRYGRWELFGVATAALLLYFVQRALVKNHQRDKSEKRSLLAELVGVVLLTLTAPAAWIAGRGRLDSMGVRVWLLNVLFFAGGVLYVKYRVRGVQAHHTFSRFGERLAFAWPVFAYHLFLAMFLGAWAFTASLPLIAVAAFTPAMVRVCGLAFHLGRRFPIKRLGWAEIAHAVLFAFLLIFAFRN